MAAAGHLGDVARVSGLGLHSGVAATVAAWASLAGGQPAAATAKATEAVGLLSGTG